MHTDGIHDPGHDLVVGIQVRGRDVAFWADKERNLRGIPAGHALQLARRQAFRRAGDAAFGPAVGNVDQSALPGHPHGQSLHLIRGHVRGVTYAPFGWATGHVVLHSVVGEHPNLTVIHVDREVHRQFSFAGPQKLAHPFVQVQPIGNHFELLDGHVIS
jgi:hypothetical protein